MMGEEEETTLIECLRRNIDVFLWETADMPSFSPEVAEHKIPTDPKIKPVQQKCRQVHGPREAIIKEEMEKLYRAGFIKEVTWPRWISNPVMVPKAGGRWRMCIDYRKLNDASRKDCYPLPDIHRLIEQASGHERMSFLDANVGYHQVPLAEEDQDKTAFYALGKTWCYVRMPFGLKNAGATYLVSVVLLRQEKKEQMPIYYISHALRGLK